MSIKITCKTPSTGKPINILVSDVPAEYTTIAEAPYYSVPDASNRYPVRDPDFSTNSNGLREGEIFFVTPLSVRNKSTEAKEFAVRIVSESTFSSPISDIAIDSNVVEFSKIVIPAGDTAMIPLQGRSLYKRDITPRIVPASIAANTALVADIESSSLIELNSSQIVLDMWDELSTAVDPDTGHTYATALVGFEDKSKRDAAILLDAIHLVVQNGVEKPVLDFARALFFQPSASSSNVESYIPDSMRSAIVYSWDFMDAEIQNLSGMTTTSKTIVSKLVGALKETFNGTYTTSDLAVSPGDLLQVKGESIDTFDIWISGEEKPSNEHVGISSIKTSYTV